MEATQPVFDAKAIAEKVRELLDSKGIPRRQHAAEIEKHLRLSASQAHRKLKGESPWSLAQIRDIASVFGVAPAELLEDSDATDVLNYAGQRCVLAVGHEELPCVAVIGAEIDPLSAPPLFVALRIGDQWRVYRSSHSPDGIKHFVEKIEIDGRQATPHKPIVAVLDDNEDSANELARALQKRNFTALPFYTSNSLLEAMNKTTFSGFVIDWLLEKETARRCIEEIRLKRNVNAPIVILTAYMGQSEHANSIVEMMTLFKIKGPYEKPARVGIIAAALEPHSHRLPNNEE
ncbi:helix-turn-helix domain-containing protein [Burkholderia gladioli]|uniref:Response regulator receiver protein n=1 Tax=Burkholderia gladioli (strain BSR3) TaxID=999541 RepID=F2LS83_BURGS|nr:helix-turn-helix domain-containing protein [Burkholderia gladioli]AEA65638.1 response regulator receiver protein [Burkholderia gladioli BSR3]